MMPMIMDNFKKIQHWDMLYYAIIQKGGYHFQVHIFELRDYVYL
jgi:hypothetical protein